MQLVRRPTCQSGPQKAGYNQISHREVTKCPQNKIRKTTIQS